MKRQAVLRKPLRQHVKDAPCVLFIPEDDDNIIRVADQNCTADKSRGDLPHKPLIKHLVQIDVRQERRNHPALRRASFRVLNRPIFHHARVQPLADEPQQHSITYPLAYDVPQLTMVQGVEELPDIDLKDPPACHLHRLVLHESQRLMRRASGPKAV